MDKHNNSAIAAPGKISELLAARETSDRMQRQIFDKTISTELSGDFILPDYMPEVKRLLQVRTAVLPPQKYIGGTAVDFSGSVNYTVIYSGSHNELFACTLSSEYEFSAAIGEGGSPASELSVWCDCIADSVTGRLLGPRKLSIRCRLKSRVRAAADEGVSTIIDCVSGADETGLFTDGNRRLERLEKSYRSERIKRGFDDELFLSERIPLDSNTGGVKPVFCDANVFISEVLSNGDGIICGGDVVLRCICVQENAHNSAQESTHDSPQNTGSRAGIPFTLTKKLPFRHTIAVSGITRECECRAWGVCSAISVTAEGGAGGESLLCEIGVTLEAEGVRNESLTITEDAYSTENECDCEYTQLELSRLLRCASGNFSMDGSVTLSEIGIEGDGGRMIDISGSAAVSSAEITRGKLVLSGESRFSVLFLAGEANGGSGEISNADFSLPFKYEIECGEGELSEWECIATVVSARGRIEGNKLFIDAEINTAARASVKSKVRHAREVHVGSEPVSEKFGGSNMLIYYPDPGETLWGLSKRFGVACRALASENGIDPAMSDDFNNPSSLSDVQYLLLNK